MAALGCDFAQVYGLTETTGAITSLMPGDHDPDGPRAGLLRSAGRPFDHIELRIVDTETGEALPAGEVGEVWTRSDQNMLGYWNKPEETAAVLSDEGWFRTGDAGWLDAGGLPLPARPDQGHDRVRRRERLSGRGGERPSRPSGRGRCRGHRRARRPMGGDGEGHRGEGPGRHSGRRGAGRGHHRRHAEPSGPLQVPDLGRLHRRPAPQPLGQGAQTRASKALLARGRTATSTESSTEPARNRAGQNRAPSPFAAGDVESPRRSRCPTRSSDVSTSPDRPRAGGPAPPPASGYAGDGDPARRRSRWPAPAGRPAGRHR